MSSSAAVNAIRVVYSIGFLVGTYTHVSALIQHGFLAYPVPFFINIYWDALTLLDPLAVVLIWTKLRWGAYLAVSIMVTDIGINAFAYAEGFFGEYVAGMIPVSLFLQSLFGLFVFTTALVLLDRWNA